MEHTNTGNAIPGNTTAGNAPANPAGTQASTPTPASTAPANTARKTTFLEETQALKTGALASSTPESGLKLKGHQRLSTDYLEKRIQPKATTHEHFTTIVPEGLPPDIVGDQEERVERHNVLNEPKGVRNEASRLPPFKPFKTISDEDNIHLLPGETGERVRLNLLDTKQVTKQDIEDVKNAYHRLKSLHPELYDDNAKLDLPEEEPPPQKSLIEQLREEEAKKRAQLPPDHPLRKDKHKQESSYSSSYSSSDSEGSSDEETDDEAMAEWQRQMQMYYAQMGAGGGGGYGFGGGGMPGFPGGYGMPSGPYPGGFGPCQMPCYNPCRQEIQYIRGKEGEEGKEIVRRKKLRKPQGLNFDFLPHDDLATEVTFTVEPDDPDPLAYSVENGVMPIICCYMPSSLAVSQMPPTTSSYAGYQSNASRSSGGSYYGGGSYKSYGSYGNGSQSQQSDKSSASLPVGDDGEQLYGHKASFGQGTAPAPSII